jgi:transcriptional regulator with XRE-family HTH domain
MDVGKRIKERRIELNISVDELAKRLNKNRTTVYRYEKGDIENLPIDILGPLAKALNTTPAYLMGWDSKPNSTIDTITDYYRLSTEDLTKEELECKGNVRIERFKIWAKKFDKYVFTDEEHSKLVEYAEFLLHRREK